MSKKILECEYCHSMIGENDKKCPSCGANCTEIIKKYHKEKEIEEQKNKENADKFGKTFAKGVLLYYVISALIAVTITALIIIFVIRPIYKEIKSQMSGNGSIFDSIKDSNKEKIKVEIDSYEFYEYHSDYFKEYNTKSGYQKIAFHFIIENVGKTEVDTYDLVSLKADDSIVEESDIEITPGFNNAVTGKEKYEGLGNNDIKPGDTLKGYVGFEVPVDKKELKFTIGSETIKMDNPAYKE